MVRLLRSDRRHLGHWLRQFQSHNGAIAAKSGVHGLDPLIPVSIPQWCDCCPKIRELVNNFVKRFNPTMVRLLPNWFSKVDAFWVCFNPTMVRLLLIPPFVVFDRHSVSIPQWCDCCRSRSNWSRVIDCFNPTMVRLLPLSVSCRRPLNN